MQHGTPRIIRVEEGDLSARLAAAHARAQADAAAWRGHYYYWAAYSFPVRPNVSVDAVAVAAAGLSATLSGVITGNVGEYETRNLGVFLLYGAGGAGEPERVEVYNLDRQRDYEGHPVYWLGSAGASESLALLEALAGRAEEGADGAKLTEAIALHDHARAWELLAELARRAHRVSVRAGAVSWLGRSGQMLSLVEEVAADTHEETFVREQAILSIGKSRADGAFDSLRRLSEVVEGHALQEAVVNSVAKSRQPGSAELLKAFAEGKGDEALRRRARMQLLKAAGGKSRAKEEKAKARPPRDRT